MVETNQIPNGFKNTSVGIIPTDWEVKKLSNIADIQTGSTPPTINRANYGDEYFFVSPSDIGSRKIIKNTEKKLSATGFNISRKFPKFSILFTCIGSTIGKCAVADRELTSNQQINAIIPNKTYNSDYLYYILNLFSNIIKKSAGETAVPIINKTDFGEFLIPLPPTITEQKAIATALNDTDELISKLEKHIFKKRAIKQGAMQELLKPKEEWRIKTLDELIICMDNLRVPLNEIQRSLIRGDYPYCGANGILDFINEYKIDDEVILIAEDGGYFDEYSYRPIAYIMKGKFWVNNHAHILKAQSNYDQNFIFYSLVHKNIQNYLASGTRAKLNKSEMYRITIDIPEQKDEQKRISQIFIDMDSEIETLEKKLEKLQNLKQGMMQNLLTGKIRLI